MWAVDEVSVAMAHQLREPLAALLLHLHEIKKESEHTLAPEAAHIALIVSNAIKETERVCTIMNQKGHNSDPLVETVFTFVRSQRVNDWSPRPKQRLTPREREVLGLVTSGVTSNVGSFQLGITKRTFETHRANIMGKLGAKNAADLIRGAAAERHSSAQDAMPGDSGARVDG
jgi:DNA-binding CsgD family transcriptional regulator